MDSVIKLIRSDLREFSAYSSARCEAKLGRVWLNANELPWENSDSQQSSLNRYPEKQPEILINKLAEYYATDPNQVLVTRGSDEGIDLLIRLFCTANQDEIMICPPTFGMYEVCARLQGANILKIPLSAESFDLNNDLLLSKWNPQVKLIFLCSPNNPTGNLIDPTRIRQLCKEMDGKSLIVVDEAYLEFSKSNSASKYLNECPNLVILRTLSKAFGLAALRVGILLANESIISWLRKILPPYPLAMPCIEAAIKALEPDNLLEMQRKINIIIAERDRLIDSLQKCALVEKVWPSEANFIFAKFKIDINEECHKRGIILRNMESRTGIVNTLRITIGKPIENSELIKLLDNL